MELIKGKRTIDIERAFKEGRDQGQRDARRAADWDRKVAADAHSKAREQKVLDKGYVRLVDSMGNDLSVVNAARVSYDKESKEFDGKDQKLINFLIRENHTAPFRHAVLSFEVYAPLFVARQWWKHIIGGQQNLDPFLAWNESSRRYVTENEEFYIPNVWRGKPADSKQGSSETRNGKYSNEAWGETMRDVIVQGKLNYQAAMEDGIAPEQARLFLPANALYVRWRWTSSLQGVMHFINLRDEAHAQWEIQQYAKAVRAVSTSQFPVCFAATALGG